MFNSRHAIRFFEMQTHNATFKTQHHHKRSNTHSKMSEELDKSRLVTTRGCWWIVWMEVNAPLSADSKHFSAWSFLAGHPRRL